MRLIDADAIFPNGCVTVWECDGAMTADGILKAIKAAPTVDAEPVRHGEWVRRNSNVYCTVCNKGYRISNGGANVFKFKRCPECGAKMDGGTENGNLP